MSSRVGLVDRYVQLRSSRNDSVPRSNNRSARGLAGNDRRLAANEEPPLGAHLITPRFCYAHHGVYVGAGTVVHYAAFAYHWHRGPVEEVSLSRFAHGHPLWVRPAGRDALRCEEIVRRARSRLGENRYRLLSNNCEHLSEWCVHGTHRSPQAERLLSGLRRAFGVCGGVRRRLTVALVALVHRSGSQKLSWAWASRVLPADPPRRGTHTSAGNIVAGPLFAQQGAMDGVRLSLLLTSTQA
jgi:Lecithin retinol acyltransferase